MRGQRTERLVRLAAKFMLCPSKLISLTDLASKFNVSKTVISDDVEVINSAMGAEGFGQMQVDRGRSGAHMHPGIPPDAALRNRGKADRSGEKPPRRADLLQRSDI